MADLPHVHVAVEEQKLHFEDNNKDKNEGVNEEAALIICSDEIQNLDGNPNGDNVFNDELENEVIVYEVEDEGRPSRIVDGDFSVSLDKYLRTMSRNPVQITFEAIVDQESGFLIKNANRGLFNTPPCPMPATLGKSGKKISDYNDDDDSYLMNEKENKDNTKGKGIWVTGRLKLIGDSHSQLVPD